MEKITTQKESTIKDFLDVVFRRKWVIVAIVVITTAVVIFLNLRQPAVYESIAKVLLKRGEVQGVFTGSVRTLAWEEEIASQIELIQSQVVLDKAHKLIVGFFPQGYTTNERISQGRVGAGVITTSNVLWVTYTSMDPVFCEAAVNAIVNSYRDYFREARTPPEMEDFFIEELQAIKEEIEYWRDRKETVEREWGIIDIEKQWTMALTRLESYQTELMKISKDLIETEGLIRRLEELRERSDFESSAISAGLLSTTRENVVEKLRRSLVDLKLQESELSVEFTDEHKKLKDIRKQIADIEEMIRREIEIELDVRRTQHDIMKQKEDVFFSLIEEFESEKETYPRQEVEMERINSTLRRLDGINTDLQEQHMQAKVSRASHPEWTVTILSRAVPAYQRKTKDYVRMALGPFFSLIVALGLAFFIDNLDHSIKSVAEAEETLRLPVLSSFPDLERK